MTAWKAGADVARLVDRVVSAAELRQAIDTPLTSEERDEILALSRWFRRRYTTPLQRLAYVRQAYRRWQQTAGRAR
jgi:hypothetical protein